MPRLGGMSAGERFERLPTATKLFLILTLAMLPIAIALVWIGQSGIREANAAIEGKSDEQARAAASAIEGYIARNALALRVAANGAFTGNAADPCNAVEQTLAITPAVARDFELETLDGKPLCESGSIPDTTELPLAAPGAIEARI